MSDELYEQLADKLAAMPNGFARTSSGIEIRMLKKIASPDEVELAVKLTMEVEPLEAIAPRFGLSVDDTAAKLQMLARRGFVRPGTKQGVAGFRLAPFIVGLYEAQKPNLDHELAHLFEEWSLQGGGRSILGPQPALHRVLPSQKAVKSEEIMPYDDVRSLLSQAKSFTLSDCICRIERSLVGFNCKFPLHICLGFSTVERPAGPNDISREEALAAIERAEDAGLVHTISNVANGWSYVCNCCTCCCFIMRGIAEFGVEGSVAKSIFFAELDAEQCTNCGICYDRCQVGAITERERVAAVDVANCIGCGLCVSTCPDKLIHLHRRPDSEVVHPPATMEEWERARLANRAAS